MTAQKLTLTDFLLARIEDVEQGAYAVIEPPPGYRPRPEDDPAMVAARLVVAECEAKRQTFKLLDVDRQDARNALRRTWAQEVLQLWALPYADHPDYRDEWRP